MEWEKLDTATQKRIQNPRGQLTSSERQIRKELFYSTGWFDQGGYKHMFRTPNPQGNFKARRWAFVNQKKTLKETISNIKVKK